MKLQLYLLLYTIKNSALKLLTIICSFFLPISGILGLLFALILADTATGIWKAKHLKQEITSRKLSAIISKLLLYELCVILFFLIDYFILNDIILVFFSVPLMLDKSFSVGTCFNRNNVRVGELAHCQRSEFVPICQIIVHPCD
jgi:hypothetical protein